LQLNPVTVPTRRLTMTRTGYLLCLYLVATAPLACDTRRLEPRKARQIVGKTQAEEKAKAANDQDVVAEEQALSPGTGRTVTAESAASRTFQVHSIGGSVLEVSVPSNGDVEELSSRISSIGSHGMLFHLISQDGTVLGDLAAPLPTECKLNIIKENPSPLFEAAQKVLQQATWPQASGTADLQSLRLGKCCKLGEFEDEGMNDVLKFFEDMDRDNEDPKYTVFQMTLIDGSDTCKHLIGVINTGSADANTGMWGEIYLRPEFKTVANIRDAGNDGDSEWEITDSTWYVPPSVALPKCGNDMTGGNRGRSPLKIHLSHALEIAYDGESTYVEGDGSPKSSFYEDEDKDEDEDE